MRILKVAITSRKRYQRNHFIVKDITCTVISDGPETIEIIPQPPIQREKKVIITEGMVIGPYDCAADCNPPCDVTWSHANSTGSSYALVQGEQTLQHIASREMLSFSCRAEGKFGQPIERTILLDVICKLNKIKCHLKWRRGKWA